MMGTLCWTNVSEGFIKCTTYKAVNAGFHEFSVAGYGFGLGFLLGALPLPKPGLFILVLVVAIIESEFYFIKSTSTAPPTPLLGNV